MIISKDPFDRNFDNLEQLADLISDVLQCSVTIEDANHRLIAYSSHQTESDSARISTIVGRRVPERIIQALWREGVFQQLNKSDTPLWVAPIEEIGLGKRLATAIRRNQEVLGYIWILVETHPFDDSAMDQLSKAANAASAKLLQLQLKHIREEQSHQDFFWKLLTGYIKAEKELRLEEERCKIRLPSLMRVKVVQFAFEITEKIQQQIRYMITTTLHKKVLLYTINHDCLLLLEDMSTERRGSNSSDIVTILSEAMMSRFDLAPERGGAGSAYAHFSKIETSYQEAMTVIELKHKFPHISNEIMHYADLGFYRFLPTLTHYQGEQPVENSKLLALQKYDVKFKTNLLETLEVFLNHNGHIKTAADFLHIHENTLSYRLKRIAEVADINLNSMDEKVTYYLELKLRRFNERF